MLGKSEVVQIAKTFRGPPSSGNGGYVGGLLAAKYPEKTVQITLKAPIPLDKDLTLWHDESGASLRDSGDTIFAEALVVDKLDVVLPSNILDVLAAAKQGVAAAADETNHDNECFTCSPHRGAGDGLQVYAQVVDLDFQIGGPVAATKWQAHDSFYEGTTLPSKYLWAALDCPGIHACKSLLESNGMTLLGRMTAKTYSVPSKGQAVTIVAWFKKSEGRKHFANTAMFDDKGALMMISNQIWFAMA